MENAPVFKPVQIRSMTEVLAEMMGADFAEDMGLPTPDVGDMMYVASTPGGSFGAGVITYIYYDEGTATEEDVRTYNYSPNEE